MRLPRVRFTIRRMMAATAIAAILLYAYKIIKNNFYTFILFMLYVVCMMGPVFALLALLVLIPPRDRPPR